MPLAESTHHFPGGRPAIKPSAAQAEVFLGRCDDEVRTEFAQGWGPER